MLVGDLGDFGLSDVLTLLAATAKSGRLALDGDDVRGRVDVRDGSIRDASADDARLPLARRLLARGLIDGAIVRDLLDGRDTLPTDAEFALALDAGDAVAAGDLADVLREQLLDAVCELSRWSRGTFRFEVADDAGAEAGTGEGAGAPGVPVDEALDEARRRAELWTELRGRTGAGDDVVRLGAAPGGAVEFDADGWQLLAFIDGARTVDDLALLSGRGAFETRRTLLPLLEAGVVDVGPVPPAVGVGQLVTDVALVAAFETALTAAGDDAPAPPPSTPASHEPVDHHRPGQVSPLAEVGRDRAPAPGTGRVERLHTDPAVDADLVIRLIEGVEAL